MKLGVATLAGAANAVAPDATRCMKNEKCLKIVKMIDIEPHASYEDQETTPRARPRPPQAAATGCMARLAETYDVMGVDG